MKDKEREIFKCITDYYSQYGYCPSVRELCKLCGIKSTATVYHYEQKLAEKGLLVVQANKKRAISLNTQFRSVPVIGTVQAGLPVLAQENHEGYMTVPSDIFGEDDLFILHVNGKSMINAGINEKDYIIVSQQETARDGEIVVALIDDEATVKTLKSENGKPYLHPENEDFEDIKPDDFKILGKAIGLIRRF